MKFEEMTITAYNDIVASKAPTPGGGSALCQIGAMACSLIEMAINVTLSGSGNEENHIYLTSQREAVARAKKAFYRLSNDDAEAFTRIAEGLKMPKDTEEDKKARDTILQKAYHRAALIPLDTMGLCREIIRTAQVRVYPLLTKYVASDSTIGTNLLRTVINGSLINVRANTSRIHDSDLAARLDRQAEQIAYETATL